MSSLTIAKSIRELLLFKYSYIAFLAFIIFSGFSISISQAFLGISIFIFITGIIKYRKIFKFKKSGLERYIGVFVIVSVILAFLSPNILGNLVYIKDFWLLFALFLAFFLHESKEDIVLTIKVITFVVLLQAVLGLVQFYFNFNIIDTVYFGLIKGLPKKEYYRFQQWRGSFLGMHLVFSMYMVFISLPLIYLSFLKRNYLSRAMISSVRLSAILSLIALFITQSKSIMVALPFSLIPLIKKKKLVIILLIVPIIVFAIAALTYNGRQKTIEAELEKKFIKSRSSVIRINIWETAFRIWKEHPVIGSGGGNYLDEFKKLAEEHPENDPIIISHAHNDYLNQLARKGIIGFIAYVYMLYGIFMFYWRNLDDFHNKFLKLFFMGLFAAFCIFLIASLFQCYFTDEEDLVMLWLSVGLAAAIVKTNKREKETIPST